MKLWVDPPNGHLWGFPKVWDSELYPSVTKWIHEQGFPDSKVEDLQWCRMWEYVEGDTNE